MKTSQQSSFTSKDQELLLQAALFKGESAINAWNEWRSVVNLEGHPDNGSFHLMPLLYLNLQKHGGKDPFMNRLKGIYRQSWYRNKKSFHHAKEIITPLHEKGIRVMLLKGAVMAALYYKNDSVRPMEHVDVLVPFSQALKAVDVLMNSGWLPTGEFRKNDLYLTHCTRFIHHSGRQFDLYWNPFSGCRMDHNRECWARARQITFTDISVLAPHSTDMLFHVIAPGVEWGQDPPIHWIADAVTIISDAETDIDWMRFIRQTEKHRFCIRMKVALNYLHDTYKAPIPSSILNAMNTLRITRLEQKEHYYKLRVREPLNNTPYARFVIYLSTYLRSMNGTGLFRSITLFPRYLLQELKAENYYDLYFHHIAKGIRETMKRLLSRLIVHSQG